MLEPVLARLELQKAVDGLGIPLDGAGQLPGGPSDGRHRYFPQPQGLQDGQYGAYRRS